MSSRFVNNKIQKIIRLPAAIFPIGEQAPFGKIIPLQAHLAFDAQGD